MCKPVQIFEEWRGWLCGEDIHSIRQQVHRMIWDAAVFNLIRKARDLALKDKEGNVAWNPAISEFILSTYFETQAMAIRRLVDRRDDVISLGRLTEGLGKNQHILIRRNIIEAAGCPYDYEHILKQCQQRSTFGVEFSKAKLSERVHAGIDALSGVDYSNRKPGGKVGSRVIKMLSDRVDKSSKICGEVDTYVNKFFAHCATAKSRQIEKADDIELTLGKIWEAQQVLCETAAFVSEYILGENFGQFLVLRAYDVFEHLTTPLATDEALPTLQEEWNDYEASTQQWADWDWQAESPE